ncbi:hypothetical protein [Roseivivax sediminis]|uniref:Uncharacterized protein n=1 Tax=Roseivivax sediminis TaxID=936889 RepID=A0A1I2B201_9RHOB|nr:hypothetical protein [Roseivivax sediminis]SFE50194.1 hypothetical protein SAMN04515678_110163 [Roseivivax sediminis]
MRSLPPLVALFVRNWIVGFALSGIFVGLLIAGDVAGLRHLILGSADGMLALFLLWFFNGIVFAGAQTGARIFLMAEDEGGHGGGHRPLIPVRVAAEARRPERGARAASLRQIGGRNHREEPPL